MIRASLTKWVGGGPAGLLALLLPGVLSGQTGSRLPAVPAQNGPLEIRVAYPAANSALTVAESTFVFGSVGDGRATLTIGGRAVPVAPNGAWIAWVALPKDSAFVLRLEARRGDATASAALPLSRADWVREEGAWVDRRSLSPTGRLWVPAGERVVLSVRAAAGSRVRLRFPDGRVVAFVNERALPPLPAGVREFDRDERNLRRTARGDRWVAVLPAGAMSAVQGNWLDRAAPSAPVATARLEVITGNDTTRTPWPLSVTRVTAEPLVEVGDGPEGGIWRPVSGRPFAGRGTYTWFFPQGTWTHADARINGDVRLRLNDHAIAWVPLEAVRPLGPMENSGPAQVASLTLTPGPASTTLRVPLTQPVPFRIDEEERRLTITLYGAIGVMDWTRYGDDNPFVRSVTWRQERLDQVEMRIDFDRPLWGWRSRVDGSDLLFEFRRPPRVDAEAPLRGRRIVVDAGHPPGGSCGPTGLCEPEANLAVAELVRDGLRRLGAQVLMSRATPESVSLRARSALADSSDVDLFVSIHNNAFPDGINPFTNSGTSVFYNHLPSLALAREAQRNLVAAFGTRDLGVARGDLSVVRPTWYPSILTEGLFLMLPEHEAALRSAEGQRLYAGAVVKAVESFFREMATRDGAR